MTSDFTLETTWVCYSNIFFERQIQSSTPGVFYKVTFGPLRTGPILVGWECECRGFTKSGMCKHISAARELRCGWNEEQSPGPAPSSQHCPECKGPIRQMRVNT
jgi:hypothetical protein